MSPSTEIAIASHARAQHGLVTRRQLVDAGLSPATVRRRVARGELVAVGVRTFRLASAIDGTATSVLAACLDRGAVASHRTAAWLHGLWALPSVIDVSVAKGRAMRCDDGALPVIVHATTSLPPDDVVMVDGIPTTSIARTMLGLAALVPDEVDHDELVDVVARAIEDGKASLAWLTWLLEGRRCRGRNGVRALEAALDARVHLGPTESWLERRLLALVRSAGLPKPALQRTIPRQDGRAARVDFVYERQRIVIEVLGYAHHRTPAQLAADTMRANQLQVRGYRVLQLSSRTLDREPDAALAVIAAALAASPA